MGALSFYGALQGLGQGAAVAGQQMFIDERQRQLEEERMKREIDRQAAITSRHDDTLALRRELADLKAAGPGGRGGGALNAAQIVADPALLAALGGGSREEADRFLDVARNGAGQMVDGAVDDESGGHTGQVRKYQPGQAADILKRGTTMLYQAMKLGDPSHADDLSKSQLTDTQRGAVEGGNYAGALAAAGKGEFGESGTSHVSGKPAKGSVAESQITENLAQARNAGASAAQHMARVEEIKAKIGLAKGDLEGKSKERLATMLNSLNTYVKDLDLSDADRAAVNELRGQITKAMSADVSKRGGGAAPAPDKPAAGAPKLDKLPPGARQIGTSKGRPVYETPDGKRFVGG